MQEAFEISKSKEDASLLAQFKGEDECLVEKMLAHIEAKEADLALRLAQERRLLAVLTEECKEIPIKDVIDDVEAYTDAVLKQPVTMAREKMPPYWSVNDGACPLCVGVIAEKWHRHSEGVSYRRWSVGVCNHP